MVIVGSDLRNLNVYKGIYRRWLVVAVHSWWFDIWACRFDSNGDFDFDNVNFLEGLRS